MAFCCHFHKKLYKSVLWLNSCTLSEERTALNWPSEFTQEKAEKAVRYKNINKIIILFGLSYSF